MSDDQLKRRLSPMDSFFLYSERDEQPMHVGATTIFDGKIPFAKFVKSLEARLHLIPRYRQRVMFPPLHVGHPTWEFDPDFDIRNHIFKVKLPKPGTDEELRRLSGRIFSGMLDRNKPLWEIYVVEGLKGNRSSLIFKVHHCMVDGVAGIGLAMILFDMTPETPKLRKPRYDPDPLPDQSSLLYDALWDNAIDGIEHWSNFQRRIMTVGRSLDRSDLANRIKRFGMTMGNFLLPLKRLPFNKPLSNDRRVAWCTMPFADARAVRAVAGGTLNDVVLTTLGGAIRLFMEENHPDEKLPRSMRVLCPVNVREEHQRAALGNHISFMPIEVPLHIADPIERLHAVHLSSAEMKDANIPESVSLMFELLQGAPAPLQASALGTVANPLVQSFMSHVTGMPPANMICTNVPGPNIPLYVCGKRLMANYPKVPVCLEMGINMALTSYDQTLFLCLCSDSSAGKDVEIMAECVNRSFAELREAAAVKQANYVRIVRASRGEETPVVPAVDTPIPAAKAKAKAAKPAAKAKPKTKAKSNGKAPVSRKKTTVKPRPTSSSEAK